MMKLLKKKRIFLIVLEFILVLLISSCRTSVSDSSSDPDNYNYDDDDKEDYREYQHGIDILPLSSGNYYLIFSSSGLPPSGADEYGNWIHDIYYSLINPNNIQINPQVIISEAEAQEPASAAINEDGHIMITMEDGWDTSYEVCQRYGVYDESMNNINAYPKMCYDGGHSGHVAASGSRFVIFFSDGWVDGGGVDDLGSGDDVLVKIYNTDGTEERTINIAVGDSSRDWWPLIAASNNNSCLVWQRFVNNAEYANLMLAVINNENGYIIKDPTQIETKVRYYTYSVEYIDSLNIFLILGTYYKGDGFAFIYDVNGNKLAKNIHIPAIIRESQSIFRIESNDSVEVCQAKASSGLIVLNVTTNPTCSISYKGTIEDSYKWQYMGTDGIYINNDTVFIVSLSINGLVTKKIIYPNSMNKCNNILD